MNLFAYPFHFSGGQVVKLDNASDAYAAQMIQSVLKVEKGELIVNPDFGTRAAEFASLDYSGLLYSISTYYPTIKIGKIMTKPDQTETVQVSVAFSQQAAS